jgi:DNA end-binding protein Ku
MALRSIWNGTITFSEVAIPVKLYAAVEQRRIRFREVRISDGSRIQHQRYGVESGKEIPSDQIGLAYETRGGDPVVFTRDELAVTPGTPDKTLALETFVASAEIDPIFYDRPYMLGPQPGGERAYRLLHDAITRRNVTGIGRFVLRSREHLAALAAHEDVLRLFTMRFADELVRRPELELPKLPAAPSGKELALAKQLIDTFAQTWEPEAEQDNYRERVMALIEAKAHGETIEAPAEPEAKPAPDLMDALRQSIEQRTSGGETRRKQGAKKAKPKAKPASPKARNA